MEFEEDDAQTPPPPADFFATKADPFAVARTRPKPQSHPAPPADDPDDGSFHAPSTDGTDSSFTDLDDEPEAPSTLDLAAYLRARDTL